MSGVTMRAAGLVVVAGLALSGCTGSTPDPGVTQSSAGESTPTVSVSPSPSVPAKSERPEAMKRDDAEGAAAAAEYFIELYPYVMATGDTEEFEAMSHRACGFCDELASQASAIQDAGETFVGGETTVTITKEYKRDEVTGIYPFDSKIIQEAQRITAPNGQVVLDADREVLDRRIEIGRRAGEWVMVTVAPVPERGK
jgi:DNA-binding LacI/PurR family transcriptional regulator